MQQVPTTEIYNLAVYALGGSATLFVSLLVWLVKTFKENDEKHFTIGHKNREEIIALKQDLKNFREECRRMHDKKS